MDFSDLDAVVVAQYFQPPHRGHLAVIEQARSLASTVVVLCLGAAESAALRTPFSSQQRCTWLEAQLGVSASTGVLALADCVYVPRRWQAALREAVLTRVPAGARIGVISDAPIDAALPASWQRIAPVAAMHNTEADIRDELLWSGRVTINTTDTRHPALTPAQLQAMQTFVTGADYAALAAEAAFIRQFKQSWAGSPYPPVFVTTDGLITRGRSIALIQRGRAPGKGLWALPGGFIDAHETAFAGACREIEEETGLLVHHQQLRASRVFDQPDRSLRGRTITHAFHFRLEEAAAGNRLPTLRAADDAAEAQWFEFEQIKREYLFEDHYAIAQAMLGFS